jgi:hypothetical protein
MKKRAGDEPHPVATADFGKTVRSHFLHGHVSASASKASRKKFSSIRSGRA